MLGFKEIRQSAAEELLMDVQFDKHHQSEVIGPKPRNCVINEICASTSAIIASDEVCR